MSATLPQMPSAASMFPHRFRSLRTLLALTVIGSIVSSAWLLPSRLERVAVAIEQGDQSAIDRELDMAVQRPIDPGEARALATVALTMGAPETAVAILEQFLAAQPRSVEGLRLLTEVQRQRRRSLDVATLDERLYALTGDPDALRESADIYASQHMATERLSALRRLASIGRATASDMDELTHRLVESGDREEALTSLMRWLEAPRTVPIPVESLGLAAGLSADTAEAGAIAARLGGLIARGGQLGSLHVLIQIYADRGRPALSLVAGRALGREMAARPDVALTLAELEATQGDFAAARARLEQLDHAGTLLPAGLPMLAELSIQSGDLDRAVPIFAALAPDQVSTGLAHRLVEAVTAAGRLELLARLPLDAIAHASPASAASVALARGDRGRAGALLQAALSTGGDLSDLGPAFGHVVHALGREREVLGRLIALVLSGAFSDESLSLLTDLAAADPNAPAALDALRAQRDRDPRVGLAWALLAARHGQSATVATWLHAAHSAVPTRTLVDLLLLPADRNEGELVRIAASALAARADLPAGWTQDEVALTARAREPITSARLRTALDLFGRPTVDDAARRRITALLVGAPGFHQLGPTIAAAGSPAIAWLTQAIEADGSAERIAIELDLLAALTPDRALALLAGRADAERRRLLPIEIASLQRTGRMPEAQTELRSALRGLPPKQQDALLYDILARFPPNQALPVLRVAAGTGRADWASAYQEKLARLGLQDELRSALRAEAASERDPKQLLSLASRLVDLQDRPGAIAALKLVAAGKPPVSPEVEQLMFLWGPRAAPEAIAWTREQALAAAPERLPKWIEHLAYLGQPGAVLAIVEQRPEVLASSASAVRTYGAALTAAHAHATPDLRSAIAVARGPDIQMALAQLALDTTQPALAWHAANAAVSASPTDPAALLLAAQAAAAARRSADAATLYTRLLALGPQPATVCIDAADALLAAKRTSEARSILETSLTKLPATPATVSAARLRGRVLMLLARDDEAAALLTEWLDRFPSHAGLRADLLQARLDRK